VAAGFVMAGGGDAEVSSTPIPHPLLLSLSVLPGRAPRWAGSSSALVSMISPSEPSNSGLFPVWPPIGSSGRARGGGVSIPENKIFFCPQNFRIPNFASGFWGEAGLVRGNQRNSYFGWKVWESGLEQPGIGRAARRCSCSAFRCRVRYGGRGTEREGGTSRGSLVIHHNQS